MGNERTKDETRAALDGLYRERQGALLGWVVAATRDELDAEDILQSVFLGAMDNLDALSAVENLGAWLFAAVRNRVVDRWRMRRRRERLGETDISAELFSEIAAAAGLDPGEDMENAALQEALAEAIAALPAPQREVIEAQVLRGESFKEISERTGVPANTLASRKRYAIQALAAALAEWAVE